MKRRGLFLIAATGFIFLAACNNGENTVKDANDSNSMKMDTTKMDTTRNDTTHGGTSSIAPPVSEKDTKFMTAAANGGMMEVALGNVAETNGMNQRVKDFGKMMVDEHSKANEEMKSLAIRKNVTLPAALKGSDQSHVDKMSKKNGKNFDKDYIDMMVSDHKKDIKEFEDEQANGSDPDLKDFITKILPTLRKHLDSAQAIQSALKGKM